MAKRAVAKKRAEGKAGVVRGREAASAASAAREAGKPAARTYPPMSAREYQRAREHYGLSNYAWRKVIGVGLRQAQRYEGGEAEIPEPVARLIRTMLAHRLAPDDVG